MKNKDIKKTVSVLFLISLVILAAFGQCFAGDKYVATYGSDYHSGNSPYSAYRTIQKALDNVADGNTIYIAAGTYNYETAGYILLSSTQNGKTITVDGGDANTTILSSSASDALRITTMSTGVITFQNMTFKSTYAWNRYIVDWNTDGGQITFNNCVLGVPSDSTTGYTGVVYMGGLTASPPTRKLSLKNTRCYSKGPLAVLSIWGINSLLIENCIIDGNNSTAGDLSLYWEIGDVNITGSFMYSKSAGLVSSYIISFGSCHIDNTVFDTYLNAIAIPEFLQSGTFTNITSNGGIYLGQGASANYKPLGTCLVKDCNFTYDSRSIATTGMSIGYGCNGITVENCRFIGFKTGLNAKTVGSNFIDCVFTGGPSDPGGDYSAIYLRATKDCNFTNVTAYSKYQYALWTSFGVVGEADINTNRNKFTNCIFDASGGGVYAYYNSNANDTSGNIFNYNCYKAGSRGLFFLQGLKNFGQWKAYWAANGSSALAKLNDINSINADPCFVDAANGDFRLKSGSLCLKTGQPVVGQENLVTYYTCDDDDTSKTVLDTGRGNIGAWQGPDGISVRDTCDMHVDSIIGGALSFDGTSDYVDCSQTYKSNSLTLSIWAKPNDGQPSDSQVIFSRRVDDGNHFEIYLNTSGLFDANCVVQGVSKTVTLYQNAKSVSALDDGDSNWIMLTAVVSDCNISGTGNLLIGSSFAGSIDDVRIYNKALSANEVETLYKEVYLIKPAGDLNGDYRVDFFDYVILANNWGENDTSGQIIGWGSNNYGQTIPPAGNNYVAIAAGGWHSLALKSDGTIIGWGNNYYGQATPPDGNNYVAIAAGGWHSLALKSDGTIIGWGNNDYGQATSPDGNNYVAIVASGWYSLALKSDGTIIGWGNNDYGQATPPAGNNYVAIAAGGWHSLALKSDGTIIGWGNNNYGQAASPAGNDYVAIAADYEHSLAIKSTYTSKLAGDLNNDHKVDTTDLKILADTWLECGSPNPADCWQ